MVMKKAYLNWSSGKDAAFALYKVQQEEKYKVERLVTTLNTENDRVSMHGLRKQLLIKQAENIGLPLHIIEFKGNISMQVYNEVMLVETTQLLKEGFTFSIFGDIFLEDLKQYREKQLEEGGIKAVFPLWKNDTTQLMKNFIDAGFKAIVVCLNAEKLDKSFCGRILDKSFLKDLPENVDACGENGEFHTFVFDGPIFKQPVNFGIGEVVKRTYSPAKDQEDNCFSGQKKSWDTGFYYCDLIPK